MDLFTGGSAMQWNDPAEIEGCITRLREDQHAQQHQLEDAVSIEMRSEAAADSARAVQCRCRTAIRDDADEIDRLLGELHDLLPLQRKPPGR